MSAPSRPARTRVPRRSRRDTGHPAAARDAADEVTTAAELAVLPAESLLVSARPSYGPDYVLVYDAGDGRLTYYAIADPHPGYLTASEVIDEYGPLEVVHRGAAPRPLHESGSAGTVNPADPWAS